MRTRLHAEPMRVISQLTIPCRVRQRPTRLRENGARLAVSSLALERHHPKVNALRGCGCIVIIVARRNEHAIRLIVAIQVDERASRLQVRCRRRNTIAPVAVQGREFKVGARSSRRIPRGNSRLRLLEAKNYGVRLIGPAA